jgi:hypothetical protein
MTHDYREVRDTVYAHIVNPQCSCGWRFPVYVTQQTAPHYFDSHVRRANGHGCEEGTR